MKAHYTALAASLTGALVLSACTTTTIIEKDKGAGVAIVKRSTIHNSTGSATGYTWRATVVKLDGINITSSADIQAKAGSHKVTIVCEVNDKIESLKHYKEEQLEINTKLAAGTTYFPWCELKKGEAGKHSVASPYLSTAPHK